MTLLSPKTNRKVPAECVPDISLPGFAYKLSSDKTVLLTAPALASCSAEST